MAFEGLISTIITLGVLLYMGIAIYMRSKGVSLTDVIKEVREGFKK